MIRVRAIRGAIQVTDDIPDLVMAGTRELITEVLDRNGLSGEDVISILFTTTPDLSSAFPAAAARQLGLHDVPLMCATEIGVPGALPRVIRLMAHVESAVPRSAIRHVYLHGAAELRRDVAVPG